MINTIIELEKEAGADVECKVGRGGTAGEAGCRVGGATEEAVVWEVAVE